MPTNTEEKLQPLPVIACWAIGVFVLLVCLFIPAVLVEVDNHHDGLMLKTSLDLFHGLSLFKDTFNQYGPGSSLIHLLFLKIGGPSLLSLKIGTAIFYALSGSLLFLSWARFLTLFQSFLALLLWLSLSHFFIYDWPVLPWSSSYALLFQSLALSVLVWRPQWTFGKIASLAVLSVTITLIRVPVGLTFSTAMAVIVSFFQFPRVPFRKGFRDGAFFVGICLILGSLFLGFLSASGNLFLWWDQVVLAPKRWLEKLGTIHNNLFLGTLFWKYYRGIIIVLMLAAFPVAAKLSFKRWPDSKKQLPLILGILFSIILYFAPHINHPLGGWPSAIPIFLIGMGVKTLFSPKSSANLERDRFALLLLPICLASWVQYYPVFCSRHFFWAISPAFGPLIYFLFRDSFGSRALTTAVYLLLFGNLFAHSISSAWNKFHHPYFALSSPPHLSGMRVGVSNAKLIGEFDAAINEYRATTPKFAIVLDMPDTLWATWATDFRNPVPVFAPWGYTEDDLASRRKFIAENRPLIVTNAANLANPLREQFSGHHVFRKVDDTLILLAPN